MPNAFLKAEVIAAVGLERLRRELVLWRMITPRAEGEWVGAFEDTINIRVPARLDARDYEWRTRNNPIIVDTLEEVTIPVSLDKHPYSAVAVTDEELTLDIRDFLRQVLEPQVIAVAEKLDSYVAAAMVAAPYAAAAIDYTSGSADDAFYQALVDARKALNDAHVPMSDRFVALGSSVEAAALKEPAFRKVNESGSTEALRNAEIGRVAGFTVIGNMQGLPEDFAVAFHRSAFTGGIVAPEVPAGVSFGRRVAESGLAMRWIRDYDSPYLRDRSVVSAFAGVASVNDGFDDHGELSTENVRAVLIDFTEGS